MTDDSEVARIAAGLSESERIELLGHTRSTYRNPRLKWSAAGHHLMKLGLLEFPENPHRSVVRLSLKGDAIRSYLQSKGGEA